MANSNKTGTVLTIDETTYVSSERMVIQTIYVPQGTTETFSITSDGQVVFSGAAQAAVPLTVQFPCGLRLDGISVTKSGSSQKIFIYKR